MAEDMRAILEAASDEDLRQEEARRHAARVEAHHREQKLRVELATARAWAVARERLLEYGIELTQDQIAAVADTFFELQDTLHNIGL